MVDAQVNMFAESFTVYDGGRVLDTVSTLINQARDSHAVVVDVRNNGDTGEPDEPGVPGWHIHPAIAPEEGDLVVDKAGTDPFQETEFQAELNTREISRIIVVGMQTEMCVAVTVRRAAELGYAVTLVGDGHTTFDWDEMSATDSIAQHNAELAEIVDVRKAGDIEFR